MNIVKVFEQSGISQGIQFFDDPSGKYGFAISAQDLADCLGLKNHRELRCKEKYRAIAQNPYGEVVASNVPVVIEPGVYEAVGRSRASNAEAFQDWLWEEVIPSIRKTGSYGGRKLTPTEHRLLDRCGGNEALLGYLTEMAEFRLDGNFRDRLPRVNPEWNMYWEQKEIEETGKRMYRSDCYMRSQVEDEAVRQLESEGFISTTKIWEIVNFGAVKEERRSIDWVRAELNKLVIAWGLAWTTPGQNRATFWNKVA